MDRYLLVSSSEKGREFLFDIISKQQNVHIDFVGSAFDARQLFLVQVYDIIIINAPLSDENGIELACTIAEKSDVSVIIAVKDEACVKVREKVEVFGVYVVGKPLNRQVFFNAIQFIWATRKKMSALYEKQTSLQKQIEDIKIIDRAKCCLIEYLGMSEQQAHRHIEKQAMDMRRSKRAIGEDILKTYEM